MSQILKSFNNFDPFLNLITISISWIFILFRFSIKKYPVNNKSLLHRIRPFLLEVKSTSPEFYSIPLDTLPFRFKLTYLFLDK